MTANDASAGRLGGLGLSDSPTTLLHDRLAIRMPAAARVEARRPSIMAAEQPQQEETRLVLDQGGERLVLMVYELFALAGADFEKTARKDIEAWSTEPGAYAVAKVDADPKLQVFAGERLKLDASREAVHVLGVLVGQEDGTVQYLAFYVNPEAAKDAAGALDLTRRIAKTLRAGARRLDSGARTATLAGLSKDGGATVDLPAGWVVTLTDGPDFVVSKVRKMAVLGSAGPSLGLYFGHHPSFQHRQNDLEEGQITDVRAPLFGQETTWKRWAFPDRGATKGDTMVEAIAPVQDNLMAHMFYRAADEAGLAEVRKVVETIRLRK